MYGVGHLAPAVADVDAIEAGEGVDEVLAVLIAHPDAPAGGDDRRAARRAAGVRPQIGEGMDQGLPIHLLERKIVCRRRLHACVLADRGTVSAARLLSY